MPNILHNICDEKWEAVKEQKAVISEQSLRDKLAEALPVRPFHQALKDKLEEGYFGLIAEIKKASPSHGMIREDFDPVTIAKAYEEAGAACLSVLTDKPFFQGANEYLTAAKAITSLPVLRKDFILDPYQVVEARSIGADCILLIVAALSNAQARELEAAALELGMDVLVEVHNQEELERAFQLQTRLLGINNRNLKTLEVDLATTETLAKLVPAEYTLVSESGIATHMEVLRMATAGVHCFLVGEALMREADIIGATRALLGMDSGEDIDDEEDEEE